MTLRVCLYTRAGRTSGAIELIRQGKLDKHPNEGSASFVRDDTRDGALDGGDEVRCGTRVSLRLVQRESHLIDLPELRKSAR
jgi:hypothetical protein